MRLLGLLVERVNKSVSSSLLFHPGSPQEQVFVPVSQDSGNAVKMQMPK